MKSDIYYPSCDLDSISVGMGHNFSWIIIISTTIIIIIIIIIIIVNNSIIIIILILLISAPSPVAWMVGVAPAWPATWCATTRHLSR